MSVVNSFGHLMSRLRAGDEQAASEVFHRFAHRLVALARTRLDRRLRQKIDPEDILQSVYKSFFRRHRQGQFDLADWDSLWSLLTLLTVRKCRQWVRRFHADRRDIDREPGPVGEPDGSGPGWEALARDPTPEEAAMLAETVENLLKGLKERDRAIVSLSLQGYAAAEISAQLVLPQRTVFRVLERVKQGLQLVESPSQEPRRRRPRIVGR
jgi:RNA polymerase sigma-70 factor (ECF subfamily)